MADNNELEENEIQPEEEQNQNDSDDKDQYNDYSDGGWIPWFCQTEGNEFFVEISEEFARNSSNHIGIQIKNFKVNLETILSPDSPSDSNLKNEE